ncbi:uncharacterized protein K452DRAFT_317141 [Aplosporella prunicola CBS 121167]|uniref:Sensitive to high expression protein 9, mitochondrial n=1 Tax=Aplosporella prunicola CBS 121167 TaxID=1176127 RepID=A0A6A6BI56_9PEZI|nr:uncharacterized protein K452DRAFT_317141 [Aplosporella prunicola CBS 121167]KAF2143676.1 hypothetical protein K452DRAFT_317141 [Aplosporella prunicola CBS 121167]
MRPVIQHASRLLTEHAALTFAARPVTSQCHFRAFSASLSPRYKRPSQNESPYISLAIRQWSSTVRSLKGRLDASDPDKSYPSPDPQTPAIEDAAKRASEPTAQEPPSPPPSPESELPSSISLPPPPSSEQSPAQPQPLKSQPEPTVNHVPNEKLPSHRQGLRWEIYKRVSAKVDEVLPKLLAAGQKVNNYTGTDYSGIESLKREIHQQELLVKARRALVEEAKLQVESAISQQTSSQKEVVGLLERKHSWSAADLERYMALIRSEHLNEQAVRQAKDKVESAERALEEARAQLEKRERDQYHEEQIWSDTIRRNSTWVTFGLMGVNILLLLSQLVVFEPWRRRRLVKEIKTVLDERTMTPSAATVPAGVAAAAPAEIAPVDVPSEPVCTADESAQPGPAEREGEPSEPAIESAIDSVVEPAGVPLEEATATAAAAAAAQPPAGEPEGTTAAENLVTADLSGPEPSIPLPAPAPASPAPDADYAPKPSSGLAFPPAPPRPAPASPRERIEYFADDCKRYARDLFSERAVSVRRVDVTTVALQGAAAGAVFVGLVVLSVFGFGGGGGFGGNG